MKRLGKPEHLALCILALLAFYMLAVTLFGQGWTWALYDELKWVGEYVRDGGSFWSYLKDDWANNRVRPTSVFAAYWKFWVFGFHPHVLRVLRIVEWLAFAGLFAAVLRYVCKLHWFWAALGTALALKAPPLMEQTRFFDLGELTALWLLSVGWLLRSRKSVAAWPVLLVAALSKESLPLLLLVAPLREKRWKELALTTVGVVCFLLYLYLHRTGYTAQYQAKGLNPVVLREILLQSLVDGSFALPLLLLSLPLLKPRHSAKLWAHPQMWNAAVFAAVAVAYAIVVFPMAWGYTYIFAPATTLFAAAVACFCAAILPEPRFGKGPATIILTAVALMVILGSSARVGRNWHRTHLSSRLRGEMFTAVLPLTEKGSIGSNCSSDSRSITFAAQLLTHTPSTARRDGPYCIYASQSLADCCQGVSYVVIGEECSYPELRMEELQRAGSKPIFANDRWRIYPCP
jgi:hypothetical protein